MTNFGTSRTGFDQAVALHRQGRADEAARAYERILQETPSHVDALIYFGSLRLSQDRAAEAEALLRRAVAAAPDAPEANANLAAALQSLGKTEDAVTYFERALSVGQT